MIKEILIIFAHIKEANAFLFQSGFTFIKKENNCFFFSNKNFQINILITGIGQKKTKKIINYYNFNNLELIIKAGTCAVINKENSIKTPLIPKYVGYRDLILPVLFENLEDKFKAKIKKYIIDKGLITLDKPLSNKRKVIYYLKNNFDLVDMETFFIMEKFPKIPVIPILVGTDRGDMHAIIDFLKEINNASIILKNVLIDIFTSIVFKNNL